MISKTSLALLAATLLCLPVPLIAAPFQNGDFEAGATGWTGVGAGLNVGGTNQGKTSGDHNAVFNGGGQPAGATVSQTFDTVVGQTYNLQFDFGAWGNPDDTHMLNATVTGGGTLLNQTVSGRTGTGVSTPIAWTRNNFRFTANSPSTTLTFTDATAIGAGSSDANLDSVSVTAINPSITPGGAGGFGTVNFLGGNLSQMAGNQASQNSTGSGGAAARAIDGNTNGNWGNGSITHTSGGANDWWQVDLDPNTPSGDPSQTYAIDQVVIYNRGDCCEARLTEFEVNVLNSDSGTTDDMNVAPNTIGDVVRIEQNFNAPLSLAEVEAFGLANFNQAPGEILSLEIGPNGQDFVNVEGDAVLNGILDVSFVDGLSPKVGDVFNLIDAGSIDFSGLYFDTGGAPFELQAIAGGSNGTLLQLAVVPEPSTFALAAFGLFGVAAFLRRRNR